MSTIEQAIVLIDKLIQREKGHPLSSLQRAVLSASLNQPRKNYAQIAHENNYSENYIKHVIAPELWKLLSEILGEKINRTNCSGQLNSLAEKLSYLEYHTIDVASSSLSIENTAAYYREITHNKYTLETPEGPVPCNSPLYINRGLLEANCYQKILEPSTFLCLNAPHKMGKTSLMARILQYGTTQNYHTVRLSLDQAESRLFSSSAKFMPWLYANITFQLHLVSELDEYWDKELGTLVSCTVAIQESVLKKLDRPLILAVDEIDQMFKYPRLTRDFFSLIQNWHEKSKDLRIWQKLRLILVISTDTYISLNTNYYIFKISSIIELPPFNEQEITDLIENCQIQTTDLVINKFIEVTGGLPYLVRLALYQSQLQNLSLEKILANATTETGIYAQHLQEKLWQLKRNCHLFTAFAQLITDPGPGQLDMETRFKLKSLGLVNLTENQARVSCSLYQDYFKKYFAFN